MIRSVFWCVVVVFFIIACVPNKKYVLLQKNDANKKNIPTDTVLRSYKLQLANYTIQPQDQLSINIKTLTPDEYNFIKELNPIQAGSGSRMMGGYLIDNEGYVDFPVLGKIKLAGLTIFQAQEKMKEVLKDLLRDPVVNIRMLNFRFTFVGEINAQVTSFNPRISLIEAIGLAGGLTELSNRENIKIIRQRGDMVDVFYVNLLDEAFLSSPHLYLQQNDIIVISALQQRPFRLYWSQNLGLFVSSVSLLFLLLNLIQN